MNLNPRQKECFFPIEEAPDSTTDTRNGKARDVRVPHQKALIAADSGGILPSNTMTGIASRPPQCPRFRRDRSTLERRAGAWLRDFGTAATRPGFSMTTHLDSLAKTAAAGSAIHRCPQLLD